MAQKCAKVPVPNGTKVPVAGGTLLGLDVSRQQQGRPKAALRKQRCSYA